MKDNTADKAMITGRWYEIRHRSPGQQYDRRSVMQYLGVAEQPGAVTHRFNARPKAGTQTMPHSWIKSVAILADDSTPVIGARWVDAPRVRKANPRKGGRR